MTDDNACTATASVTVQQPEQIQIITSTTNGSALVDTVTGGASPYTFVWSNGATTQSISGLLSGNYLVTVTDNNGCTAAAGVAVLDTHIGSVANEIAFSVYPNPATNQVLLTLDKVNDKSTVDLKNVLGQILYSRNVSTLQSTIDLAVLANGIYFIEVKQGDKKAVKQIVVSK